jgi:hypothetical protein
VAVLAAVHDRSSSVYAGYLPEAGAHLVGPSVPLVSVTDDSMALTSVRVVCMLRPRTDVARAERWLRSVWPVTVEVHCRLPAPMRRRLLAWDRGDGSGLSALRSLVHDVRD